MNTRNKKSSAESPAESIAESPAESIAESPAELPNPPKTPITESARKAIDDLLIAREKATIKHPGWADFFIGKVFTNLAAKKMTATFGAGEANIEAFKKRLFVLEDLSSGLRKQAAEELAQLYLNKQATSVDAGFEHPYFEIVANDTPTFVPPPVPTTVQEKLTAINFPIPEGVPDSILENILAAALAMQAEFAAKLAALEEAKAEASDSYRLIYAGWRWGFVLVTTEMNIDLWMRTINQYRVKCADGREYWKFEFFEPELVAYFNAKFPEVPTTTS